MIFRNDFKIFKFKRRGRVLRTESDSVLMA